MEKMVLYWYVLGMTLVQLPQEFAPYATLLADQIVRTADAVAHAPQVFGYTVQE